MRVFRATICGRFAPLPMLVDDGAEMDSVITQFNKVVVDTATERQG